MKSRFDSIESVITDIRKGKMVIVVDDADRENEGDLIMAAQHVSAQAINFMAKYGRGVAARGPHGSGGRPRHARRSTRNRGDLRDHEGRRHDGAVAGVAKVRQ